MILYLFFQIGWEEFCSVFCNEIHAHFKADYSRDYTTYFLLIIIAFISFLRQLQTTLFRT